MADHDHNHDHPSHHHIDYQSVSLVSAVACPRCGVYLSSQFTGEHNLHHDQLDEIARQLADSGGSPKPIGKKTKAPKSGGKKASSSA